MKSSSRSTHFSQSWIDKEECRSWLAKGQSSTEAKCLMCETNFSIAHSGFGQVQQHARSARHISKVAAGCHQSRLTVASTGTVTLKPGSGRMLCHDDKVSRAEIVMLLRLVKHSYSFSSYDDLSEVLKYILPDDEIVRDMSLASTKCMYSLAYGLGPHYHNELVKDAEREFYSLIVDEATTQQNKKQFDILIKYWSATENLVVTRYLSSCFLGHATADIMNSSIIDTLSREGLSLNKILMLSSDGPNVNVSLKKKLNEAVKECGGKSLVEIGSCNLHAAHNAFRHGLAAVPGWGTDEFVTDIFYWFKNYPSRSEDYLRLYNAIADKDLSVIFKRFVDNRWLSIGPVIDRVVEHFDTLHTFFLQGKFDKATTENARFKRICGHLQSKLITLGRLQFVRSMSKEFEHFLTIFQQSQPLIHELHDAMTEVLRNLLLRFVPRERVAGKPARELVQILEKDLKPEEFLSIQKIDIGSDVTLY